LDHQNNYIERLSVDDNAAKSFNILVTNWNILYNYFVEPNKIIFKSTNLSNLVKFLDRGEGGIMTSHYL